MAGLGGCAGFDREVLPYEGLRFDGWELTECDVRCEDFNFFEEGGWSLGLPCFPFSDELWPFVCKSAGLAFFLWLFDGGRLGFLSVGCAGWAALLSRSVRSMAFCRSRGRGLHSAQE